MMSCLRRRVPTLWVLLLSILPHGARIVGFGAEAGKASTAALAAAGGVVGGVAITAAALRGGGRAARTVFRTTSKAALESLPKSTALYGELDELALLAGRKPHWDTTSKIIAETSIGKGLSLGKLESMWMKDPTFRAKAFERLASSHPEQMARLTEDLFSKYRPFATPQSMSQRLAVREALKAEEVLLYDAASNPIPENSSLWKSASSEFRERASENVVVVLDRVQFSELKSEQALRKALAQAFQETSGSKYGLDTGKLKISYKTADGEFTGEVNACSLLLGTLANLCDFGTFLEKKVRSGELKSEQALSKALELKPIYGKSTEAEDPGKRACKGLSVLEKLCSVSDTL